LFAGDNVVERPQERTVLMFGLSNRLSLRVSSIQRKVTVRRRTPGRASFQDLSQRLSDARRQVAQGRKGR
jgi:hypothetical protein